MASSPREMVSSRPANENTARRVTAIVVSATPSSTPSCLGTITESINNTNAPHVSRISGRMK